MLKSYQGNQAWEFIRLTRLRKWCNKHPCLYPVKLVRDVATAWPHTNLSSHTWSVHHRPRASQLSPVFSVGNLLHCLPVHLFTPPEADLLFPASHPVRPSTSQLYATVSPLNLDPNLQQHPLGWFIILSTQTFSATPETFETLPQPL